MFGLAFCLGDCFGLLLPSQTLGVYFALKFLVVLRGDFTNGSTPNKLTV